MGILLDFKCLKLEKNKDIRSRIKLIFLKIIIFLYHPIEYFIIFPLKRFIRGVKNIFLWLPIIYKDAQWDYSYIYIILRKKLKLMEKFFRSDKAVTVDAKKQADEINECIKILDRLIEGNYAQDKYESYYKKWGKPEIILDNDTNNGYYNSNTLFRYKNVKTEEDDKKRREELLNIMRLEADERIQDKQTLFAKLNDEIETWWD